MAEVDQFTTINCNLTGSAIQHANKLTILSANAIATNPS
jgi:hypothetical protein